MGCIQEFSLICFNAARFFNPLATVGYYSRLIPAFTTLVVNPRLHAHTCTLPGSKMGQIVHLNHPARCLSAADNRIHGSSLFWCER